MDMKKLTGIAFATAVGLLTSATVTATSIPTRDTTFVNCVGGRNAPGSMTSEQCAAAGGKSETLNLPRGHLPQPGTGTKDMPATALPTGSPMPPPSPTDLTNSPATVNLPTAPVAPTEVIISPPETTVGTTETTDGTTEVITGTTETTEGTVEPTDGTTETTNGTTEIIGPETGTTEATTGTVTPDNNTKPDATNKDKRKVPPVTTNPPATPARPKTSY